MNMVRNSLLALVLSMALLSNVTEAVTVQQAVDALQGWLNARDNGSFSADLTTYAEAAGSGQSLVSQGTMYFRDDPTNGWSTQTDMTLYCGALGSIGYKFVDTPSGEQAFLGTTCVYPPDGDLVGSWSDQSHASIPKVFYFGDAGQTSLQALESVTTSRTASGTTVYELSYVYDISAMNALIADASKQLNPSTDSWSQSVSIDAATGAPTATADDMTADGTASSGSTSVSVNTSPTIPPGTFDLTEDEPTMTFDEALEAWANAQLGI